MEHVLDNPIWSALTSGNKNLALGNEQVKFFDRDVSPFIALKDYSEANFHNLHDSITHTAPLIYLTPRKVEIPAMWKLLNIIEGRQMVYESDAEQDEVTIPLKLLTTDDVPQMLELTKLTNPGPFGSGTINFGHYMGVFDEEKLVAMTGQRMYASPYAEVSAVCTHPDYTGKGCARQLLLHHMKRMKAAQTIPYLHVRNNNFRAIKVYESMGFTTRSDVYFYVIEKA